MNETAYKIMSEALHAIAQNSKDAPTRDLCMGTLEIVASLEGRQQAEDEAMRARMNRLGQSLWPIA